MFIYMVIILKKEMACVIVKCNSRISITMPIIFSALEILELDCKTELSAL
jgi:hypothetical protein